MNIHVKPSPIGGIITAPSSKSMTHRAIIMASLAAGESVIENPLLSDDTKSTTDGLHALGIPIDVSEEKIVVHGGRKKLRETIQPIALENSGTSLRLLTGLAALIDGRTVFTGSKRLLERPISDLSDALAKIGVTVQANGTSVTVRSNGKIPGGTISIDATKSSQFLSSLLFISPFAEKETTLTVNGLRSMPYVKLTVEMMRQSGVTVITNDAFTAFTIPGNQVYKPRRVTVEGDYSSSSYFFAAAAIIGGEVTVKNLSKDSSQGDRYFLDILKQMSCSITQSADAVTVRRKRPLQPVSIDMGNYPDIVQTTAAVAAVTQGETTLRNIEHLRHKETNRIEDTATELRKFGIRVTAEQSALRIQGGEPVGTTVTTHNDHRMAMAFSVLGLGAKGKTVIKNAEVVSKSYPDFFVDLKKIGGDIKESV